MPRTHQFKYPEPSSFEFDFFFKYWEQEIILKFQKNCPTLEISSNAQMHLMLMADLLRYLSDTL
jgi:hypothetical protein